MSFDGDVPQPVVISHRNASRHRNLPSFLPGSRDSLMGMSAISQINRWDHAIRRSALDFDCSDIRLGTDRNADYSSMRFWRSNQATPHDAEGINPLLQRTPNTNAPRESSQRSTATVANNRLSALPNEFNTMIESLLSRSIGTHRSQNVPSKYAHRYRHFETRSSQLPIPYLWSWRGDTSGA